MLGNDEYHHWKSFKRLTHSKGFRYPRPSVPECWTYGDAKKSQSIQTFAIPAKQKQ